MLSRAHSETLPLLCTDGVQAHIWLSQPRVPSACPLGHIIQENLMPCTKVFVSHKPLYQAKPRMRHVSQDNVDGHISPFCQHMSRTNSLPSDKVLENASLVLERYEKPGHEAPCVQCLRIHRERMSRRVGYHVGGC